MTHCQFHRISLCKTAGSMFCDKAWMGL